MQVLNTQYFNRQMIGRLLCLSLAQFLWSIFPYIEAPFPCFKNIPTSVRTIGIFISFIVKNQFSLQVLNRTSLWWFDKTKHIVPNAVVAAPDPNVTIATKCNVFPVALDPNVTIAPVEFLSVYLLRGTIFFDILWMMNVCDTLYLP